MRVLNTEASCNHKLQMELEQSDTRLIDLFNKCN